MGHTGATTRKAPDPGAAAPDPGRAALGGALPAHAGAGARGGRGPGELVTGNGATVTSSEVWVEGSCARRGGRRSFRNGSSMEEIMWAARCSSRDGVEPRWKRRSLRMVGVIGSEPRQRVVAVQ